MNGLAQSGRRGGRREGNADRKGFDGERSENGSEGVRDQKKKIELLKQCVSILGRWNGHMEKNSLFFFRSSVPLRRVYLVVLPRVAGGDAVDVVREMGTFRSLL